MDGEVARSINRGAIAIRVSVLVFVAFIVPQVISWWFHGVGIGANIDSKRFKLGVENLSASFIRELYTLCGKDCRVGLITNSTGRDQYGNRTVDILLHRGLRVTTLFVPRFERDHYKKAVIDPTTRLPVVSITKGNFKQSDFQNIDVLFFDMQDDGTHSAEYFELLLSGMKAAGSYAKRFVVLDRPNASGDCIEGVLLAHIPLWHGMTVGEIAHYMNKQVLEKAVSLLVVPMKGYHRNGLSERSLIASVKTGQGYDFLKILQEVAPLDIGMHTDKAYRCIGLPLSRDLPKHRWYELQTVLSTVGIESEFCRYINSRTKKQFSGLTIAIKDKELFSSFKAVLLTLDFFKHAGIPLTFTAQFDVAMGTPQMREFLEGRLARSELEKMVNNELHTFFKRAAGSFMYAPLPKVVTV